jgi:hypothetical protein
MAAGKDMVAVNILEKDSLTAICNKKLEIDEK